MPAKAANVIKRQKAGAFYFGRLDMSSAATLENFRNASKAYTVKAVKSKAAALKTLHSEGIVTKKGKLSKTYATSKG